MNNLNYLLNYSRMRVIILKSKSDECSSITIDSSITRSSKLMEVLLEDKYEKEFILDIPLSILYFIVDWWINKNSLNNTIDIIKIFHAADYLQDDILMNECGRCIAKKLQQSKTLEEFEYQYKTLIK